ncbi:hypothetical protein N7466_000891 [Penicillium verhagenii]|uniref:uncharacterized protein n=1 Tax=Penicillium verhagenii TaxID=1562060 RepID=UPI002545354E|nr:uncharacterized protein N7466_000891 [Penicillium verhagenii]KAJ5947876.1 hypothetical protein N7466_000891 [Penicillium verhagenii]
MFEWFKSIGSSRPQEEKTWDATTMTMQQPSSLESMTATPSEVSTQPTQTESMDMKIRGGGPIDACYAVVWPALNAAIAVAVVASDSFA